MENDPLSGVDERLARLYPLCQEDAEDFAAMEVRITTLRDEIAKLEEQHCPECPRTQEMLTSEHMIARRKLLLLATEHCRKRFVEEIEQERSAEEMTQSVLRALGSKSLSTNSIVLSLGSKRGS